jgi:hypothetical protein
MCRDTARRPSPERALTAGPRLAYQAGKGAGAGARATTAR